MFDTVWEYDESSLAMTWSSKAEVKRALIERAKAADLTVRTIGTRSSDCVEITDDRHRRVLVAVKEHGRRAIVERRTSWIGVPTPLLEELVRSDATKASAVILVMDKWTGDLLAIPFEQLYDMWKLREQAHGKLGNPSFHIRRDSPGYLIQTPTDARKIRVDHVNTFEPIFSAFT